MDISFTVPTAKVSRVVAALNNLHAVPKDIAGKPFFTPNQWARECIRRWIISQVLTYEGTLAKTAVPSDDELVS